MNRRERRAASAGARRGTGPAHPAPSPAMALHARVAEAERGRAEAILSRGLAPQAVSAVVIDALGLAQAVLSHNPTPASSLACRPGCNHCCHRPVGTTAPSVLHIAATLRAELTEEQFADVLARVVALDEKTHGLAWVPTIRLPLPCAFLVDGGCSIYAIRPFVCRAWNAVDAEDCRRALEKDAVPMRFDLYQRTTFAALEKGLQTAVAARGLDGGDLEFTAAMRVALENADACERWLSGEPIFAKCKAQVVVDSRRFLPVVGGLGGTGPGRST